ncbi:hypothetical protein Tco_0981536 [Tanacetum coccineum]
MPFVTSSVTLTPEREGGGHTDSVFGPNLCTHHPAERFVISSDSSHHSSTNAADVEVTSIVRSPIPPPLASYSEPFADFASPSASGPDTAGPSDPRSTEISADNFYVSQEMDSETLQMIDQLAPPGFFSQLRGMDYNQLFAEFNVGATSQTCLSIEEKDAEIASLKSQLSLKEAEAAEAIRLRSQLSCDELSIKADSLESERDGLVDLVSLLEGTCSRFRDQVKIFSDHVAELDSELMGMAVHLDEEFYPRFLTTMDQ